MDERIHRLLQNLGKSLAQALSDSPDVHHAMRRLRKEGYSIEVFADCHDPESGEKTRLKLATSSGAPEDSQPEFRLSTSDVSFLKSVGIDPTRRVRRRKKSQPF